MKPARAGRSAGREGVSFLSQVVQVRFAALGSRLGGGFWYACIVAEKKEITAKCFRHPTKTAKRRCYYCKRPICPACQERHHGHIYCSQHCAGKDRRRERRAGIALWNKRALSGAWFRIVIFGLLIAFGGAIIWVSRRADHFISPPVVILPEFKRVHEKSIDRETLDWNAPGPIRIDSPKAGAVLYSNKITVSGTAPKEAMVGLYVNGRKVDVQLAREGTWSFLKVPLTGRRSVIQARYFDNMGNSSYSPAVWLELRTKPALALPVLAPTNRELPGRDLTLIRADTSKRDVLLTFDGGSNANSTPAILDILKREKIHATMFLTGQFMRRYPDLVRRIVKEGNTVGNHTFSHPHLTSYSFNARQSTLAGVTSDFLAGQLRRANEVFRLITGKNMAPFWRAPFGEFNRQIVSWAAEAGYRNVYWTPHLDTLDWVADVKKSIYHSPQFILRRLLRHADRQPYGLNGGVILMHLGSERPQSQRLDVVLDQIIEGLKERSYTFTTVDKTAWGRKTPPTAK